MSDLMSMLSNLFGSPSNAPPSSMPQQAPLGYSPPAAPVTDPLGGDMLRPGGPQPGMLESLRTALGDKLGGFATEIAKGLGPKGAPDPEGAALAKSMGGAATLPQPAPGGAPAPGPAAPQLLPGQVAHDGPLPSADNVGGSVAAGLRTALAGGGAPAPRPPMGGGAGGAAAPGGPAPAVGGPWQTQTKPTGPLGGMFDNIGLKDVQDFVRHVATGVAGANPKTSMLQAMAQGAAGSSTAAQRDAEAAEGKATKAEDKAFDRKMKTDEFGLKKNADDRAGRREDREGAVSEARINYLNARAEAALKKQTSGNLDNKDISAFNTHMRGYGAQLRDDVKNGRIKPEEFDRLYNEEAQRQIQQYTTKTLTAPGGAKGPGGVAAPPPAPPKLPMPGDVVNGYKYTGPADGNRADKSLWQKVQ